MSHDQAGHTSDRPIVLVMWVDSGFSYAQGWTEQEEVHDRARAWDGYVTTTGYLMYEDERCVVIAQSRDGGDGTSPGEPRWAAHMLINRINILKVEPLIPMSASDGAQPLASASATSAPASPAIPDVLRKGPFGPEHWCYTHTAYEGPETYREDHDGYYAPSGAQRGAPEPQGDS